MESSSLLHILGHTHLPYLLYLYPITDSITSGISITTVTLTAIPAVKPFGVRWLWSLGDEDVCCVFSAFDEQFCNPITYLKWWTELWASSTTLQQLLSTDCYALGPQVLRPASKRRSLWHHIWQPFPLGSYVSQTMDRDRLVILANINKEKLSQKTLPRLGSGIFIGVEGQLTPKVYSNSNWYDEEPKSSV